MNEQVIVVVGDDEDTRDFMELCLADAGYHVLTWPSRRGALSFILNARPDLVIIDFADGPTERWVALLQELRADPTAISIPAILYSADEHFLRCRREELRRLQCDPLIKPFALDHLLNRISHLLSVAKQAEALR